VKAKIEAGVDIELLTQSELREEIAHAMTAWRAELSRGVKYRKFSAQTVLTGATWAIGGDSPQSGNEVLGPEPGFMWSITRLAVSGGGFNSNADTWSIFTNSPTPSNFILLNFGFGDQWDTGVIVLNGPDKLAFTGAGTGVAGTDIIVSGAAVEVPVQQGWRLI
jgi:hypothetical protein